METTTDRGSIPKLDEAELIKLNESNLQKIGTKVAGVIGVLAAATLTTVGLKQNDIEGVATGLVLLGAAAIVAMAILAWALVSAADIRARGQATAANLALRALPIVTTVSAPAGVPGTSAGLWVHIKGREAGDKHLVIGTRPKDNKTEVLLARNDETPTWHALDKLDNWEVKTS